MNNLYHVDQQGLCHLTNQGIIELAYQDKLESAVFEWQDSKSKQHYCDVAAYLDLWPMHMNKPPIMNEWKTPATYSQINLREYVIMRCANQVQHERAHAELCIIEHLQAENIFKHLIYLVDTWRSQNLVWGVGRGSSVSCLVLYLIGVNKINPLDYDLPMTEFFKLPPEDILNIINNRGAHHGQNIT